MTGRTSVLPSLNTPAAENTSPGGSPAPIAAKPSPGPAPLQPPDAEIGKRKSRIRRRHDLCEPGRGYWPPDGFRQDDDRGGRGGTPRRYESMARSRFATEDVPTRRLRPGPAGCAAPIIRATLRAMALRTWGRYHSSLRRRPRRTRRAAAGRPLRYFRVPWSRYARILLHSFHPCASPMIATGSTPSCSAPA